MHQPAEQLLQCPLSPSGSTSSGHTALLQARRLLLCFMGLRLLLGNVYNERHLKLYSTRFAYMHATSSLHQRRSCLELAAPHRETVSSSLRGDPFHGLI